MAIAGFAICASQVRSFSAPSLGPVSGTAARQRQHDTPATRLAVPIGPEFSFSFPIAISPDGTKLAFMASREATRTIFVRDLNSFESRPLVGNRAAGRPVLLTGLAMVGFLPGRFRPEGIAKHGRRRAPRPHRVPMLCVRRGMGGRWNALLFRSRPVRSAPRAIGKQARASAGTAIRRHYRVAVVAGAVARRQLAVVDGICVEFERARDRCPFTENRRNENVDRKRNGRAVCARGVPGLCARGQTLCRALRCRRWSDSRPPGARRRRCVHRNVAVRSAVRRLSERHAGLHPGHGENAIF